MDQIPAVFFVLLWAIVILQGLAIVFLYRLVGLNLLGRAEALTRDGLKPGKRLPEVELRTVGRNELAPAGRGKWELWVCLAPGCMACRGLLPDLAEFARKHPEIDVIALSGGDESEARAEFGALEQQGIPLLYDPRKRVFGRFQIRVTPFGYLVDERRIVRSKGLLNNTAHLYMLFNATSSSPTSEKESDGKERPGSEAGTLGRVPDAAAR